MAGGDLRQGLHGRGHLNPPDAVETGTLRGPASFGRIRDAYDHLEVRPSRFIDAGDDVVVVATLTESAEGRVSRSSANGATSGRFRTERRSGSAGTTSPRRPSQPRGCRSSHRADPVLPATGPAARRDLASGRYERDTVARVLEDPVGLPASVLAAFIEHSFRRSPVPYVLRGLHPWVPGVKPASAGRSLPGGANSTVVPCRPRHLAGRVQP